MKWFLRIALVIGLMLAQPATAQAPALTATWQPQSLHIVWHAAEPVRLYLTGGGYHDEWIEQAGITPSGEIRLPIGGVDQAEAPQLREWIELRNAHSETIHRLAVPERPKRFLMILPVVARS